MATYTILEEMRNEVEKKLKRLQKKANRYNIPFAYTESEPYGYEVEYNVDGQKVKHIYEVYDLSIEAEVIKNGDYTIIARIEHTPTGNIVNTFVGEMQSEWAHIPAHCDHCNGNHGQKFTFIVDNGEERKQVGRTCLKEYCGIDPQTVGMVNEFFGDIEEFTPEGYDFIGSPIAYGYETTEILAHAIEAYDAQGYRKSDEYGSNKSVILDAVNHGDHPSKEAMEKAEKLSDAIVAMSIEDAVDANLNNVQTRIKGYYCKASEFGYFAYAPVAYEKYIKRIEEAKRRAEEKEALGANSEYVGTVGERTEFEVKEVKLLTSWESQYGITYLYRFIDKNDNVLIWFASTSLGKWVDGEWHDAENVERIKATVKDHSERDGVKQTIITRVKVA